MADIKAKRHALLKTLSSELSKGFIDTTVKVNGHNFKISTLNEDEEAWADGFIRTSPSAAAIYSARKAPRLAVAIKAIDDVPVGELFLYPDDMAKEVRERLDANPIDKQVWLRNEMLLFLSSEGNRTWINKLYDALSDLDDKRDESTAEIKNS